MTNEKQIKKLYSKKKKLENRCYKLNRKLKNFKNLKQNDGIPFYPHGDKVFTGVVLLSILVGCCTTTIAGVAVLAVAALLLGVSIFMGCDYFGIEKKLEYKLKINKNNKEDIEEQIKALETEQTEGFENYLKSLQPKYDSRKNNFYSSTVEQNFNNDNDFTK